MKQDEVLKLFGRNLNSDKNIAELERKENKRKNHGQMEDCFKLLQVQGEKVSRLCVPACVQFKIRNITNVDFESLTAVVNGLLCINFLIFTQNQDLETMLLERLYWNPIQQKILQKNRRKKIERDGNANFVPVMFNKDCNIKFPTTRSDQAQIQAYKTRVWYRKHGVQVLGWRIFHVIRKQFKVEIIKNGWTGQFLAPFNRINLDLNIALDEMQVKHYQYDIEPKQGQSQQQKQERLNQKAYSQHQSEYLQRLGYDESDPTHFKYKRVLFNILRIQQPFTIQKMKKQIKQEYFSPMISYSKDISFGKYDLIQTSVQAYTHDQRQLMEQGEAFDKTKLFKDSQPFQRSFQPFKYALFKIPLFRYTVVDIMSIFIPIWLLSFMSIYIFYQTTQIMNRIMNVSALMIAYAAIQPIVRDNLPDVTIMTLVDLLIYMQLLINILFLARSIDIRSYDDEPANTGQGTNSSYNRWQDPLFIISIVISVLNFIIIMVLLLIYWIKKRGYKTEKVPKHIFAISSQPQKRQNWTLKILMDRAFARYKETLTFLD